MFQHMTSKALPALLILLALACAAPVNASGLQQCTASMDGALPHFTPSDFHFSGQVRRYYIAAEQETWDYIPTGWDNWLGLPISDSPRAKAVGYTASGSLGTRWEKALYRGYTDATFRTRTAQPKTQGINGPTIRAEVGDMIEILFMNQLLENYASMHSMGLAYTKGNEGSLYPNSSAPGVNQSPPIGDAVPPGQCYVYKWLVNDGSAPTQGEPSHMWAYHSYVSMLNDLNAGLMGPTIVYPRGQMNTTMSSHREFVLLYMNFDEAQSFLSATNARNFGVTSANTSVMSLPSYGPGYGNYSIWHPQIVNINSATQLSSTQAPTFRSLNGRSYANNPPFEMCLDDKVIWYVYALGSASHVFHMHGNGVTLGGMNKATVSINDGEMMALQMTATGLGEWQVICHVANHLADGMADNYIVHPTASCPLQKLTR